MGDSWRVAMDSCLPVIHLIDTRRSIPCAIKQVQELLGISCAFEQAVQRLSTSVMMVTKGVLKDHLVLLANSMTCSGNLIGFNMGGIKALSRSLNMQVPFTEATLSAPRKCFERAAEKCHVDSLSSVVASCSWGKQVALGTGSAFDILLDTRKVELNQPDGIDVYDFLHMVKSSLNGEETTTACIGAEIENLDLEDDMEDHLSPLRDSERPSFEDTMEFDDNQIESRWERDSPLAAKENSGGWGKKDSAKSTGAWDHAAASTKAESGGAWGKKVNSSEGWNNENSGSWGKKDSAKSTGAWDHTTGSREAESGGAWGKKVNSSEGWNKENSGGWGKRDSAKSTGAWDNMAVSTDAKSGGAWGKKVDSSEVWNKGNSGGWGKNDSAKSSGAWDNAAASTEAEYGRAWGKKVDSSEGWDKENSGSWGKKDSAKSTGAWDHAAASTKVESGGAWGKKVSSSEGWNNENSSCWGKKDSAKFTSAWDHTAASTEAESGGAWGKKVNSSEGWNKNSGSWGKKDSPPASKSSGAGDHAAASTDAEFGGAKTGSGKGWNKNGAADTNCSDWSKPEIDVKSSGGWGKNIHFDKGVNKDEHNVWGGAAKPKHCDLSKQENDAVHEDRSTTGAEQKNESAGTNSGGLMRDVQSQWGPRRRFGGQGDANESSRGWSPSNNSEWKNKRNHPAQSVDNFSATYTKTKQRLDIFTAEEQDILSDVEPIMENIRRIMNQTGYNDGDPLSAVDQSYIVDNVLNFHPDKAIKIGAGIDHVMISRHASFQESRCFYIVSSDDHKQDFSYRKSLENFIKGKYPDRAEAFVSKYFRKPQPRPGWNRERGCTPDGGGTPREQPRRGWSRGWNRDSGSTPDEAGTPREEHRSGWSRGWGTERGCTPEEAGTSQEPPQAECTPDEAGIPHEH